MQFPAVNVFYHEQSSGFLVQGKKPMLRLWFQITPQQGNYAHPKMLVAMIKAGFPKYTPKRCYSVHMDHGNEEHALIAIRPTIYTSI